MNRTVKIVGITCIAFFIYYFASHLFFHSLRTWLNYSFHQLALSHVLTYVLLGTPLYIGTVLITTKKNFCNSLGLSGSILQGAGVALLFTSPMFVGYAFVFDVNLNLSFTRLIQGVAAAGFFEELYFRAFLFGMIYRYTRIGFMPAIFFGALLFASGHLHQSTELSILIGVFISTFMGAIFFAWLYCEWKFNLWVPIFMHMLMNLAWMLYDVSGHALGGQSANVFRFITIGCAIIFTLIYKKRQHQTLEITRKTLWLKPTLAKT